MDIVNEKSTAYLAVQLRDKAGKLAAPSAVTYRIDCLTTGGQVKAWTAVTPAAEFELVISAPDNAILGDNEREIRRVTVVAAYGGGTDDQATAEFNYAVRNLQFVE